MSEKTEKASGSMNFTDLSSFEAIKVQRRKQTGNVIKGSGVVSGGAHAIELHESAGDHPSVVVHRNGDKVERIEFVCQCGRGTSVTLEYDGE